jgi:thiol-disulfide isomerase/thioredoxin
MKSSLLAFAITLVLSLASAFAAENASFDSELKTLVQRVQTKIDRGTTTEFGLAQEFKEFDALVAKYASDSEKATRALFMKGLIYIEVLGDAAKGLEVFQEIETKYPKTEIGEKIGEVIASVKQQAEAQRVNAALVPGKQFPPFEVKDINGNPLSIASSKGKVILIDFWATWCGPCVAKLPKLVAIYDKYHNKGFDIIGISLDREKAAMTSFIKRRKMTWPQYFDGKMWDNKLARQYGISAIPAAFLVDSSGKILARDVTADELEEMLPKLLESN